MVGVEEHMPIGGIVDGLVDEDAKPTIQLREVVHRLPRFVNRPHSGEHQESMRVQRHDNIPEGNGERLVGVILAVQYENRHVACEEASVAECETPRTVVNDCRH